MVEIAFAMSILAPLVLGAVELARFVLLQQKLDRVAATVGDLASRGRALTPAQINDIFASIDSLVSPFDFDGEGEVILSSIDTISQTDPRVAWQYRGNDTAATPESKYGAEGDIVASMAGEDGLLDEHESVIVAEVFFDFEPLFVPDLIGPVELYHRALFRPRLSDQVLEE
ncbi:hypothetical protein [Inquilinus sp. CAU 1745]|uniref:TadE/TadG family type IV pilus assembly protein n=1 Tax=Inquilinus sp. CAU 1745 TaxID=3140369 RepID=UPI00325BFF0D